MPLSYTVQRNSWQQHDNQRMPEPRIACGSQAIRNTHGRRILPSTAHVSPVLEVRYAQTLEILICYICRLC